MSPQVTPLLLSLSIKVTAGMSDDDEEYITAFLISPICLFIYSSVASPLTTSIVTLSPNLPPSSVLSFLLHLLHPPLLHCSFYITRAQHFVWNSNGRTATLRTIALLGGEVGRMCYRNRPSSRDENHAKVKGPRVLSPVRRIIIVQRRDIQFQVTVAIDQAETSELRAQQVSSRVAKSPVAVSKRRRDNDAL